MKKTSSAFQTSTILLMMFVTVVAANNIRKVEADETLPILQITPSYYEVENIGEFLSLNLTIINVTDLYGWEVKIYYLNTVVECVNATEGAFLQSENDTFWITPIIDSTYNATYGRMHIACSLTEMIQGVNGSGVLATITFQAKYGGNTTLHLADTKLADSNTPYHNPILHTTTDGFISVGEFHNIVIINVSTSKTIVAQGYCALPLNITATVENKGNRADTFNVTAYANSTKIENKTVSNLAPNTQVSVTFTWNATGFAKGNYTVSAVADTVPGETNTTDNTLIADECVCVTLPGDVDCDRDVDLYDAVKLLKRYGAKKDQQKYDPNCDIDCDGDIDLYDAVILLIHYGQKDP